MRKSYLQECQRWYNDRLHLGHQCTDAKAFAYSWHEENEPAQCKIGYCSTEPFAYLWGNKFPHQKRLPVIFLTIGASSSTAAKSIEALLHKHFEAHHMVRSCAREWFEADKEAVCEAAKALIQQLEREGAL